MRWLLWTSTVFLLVVTARTPVGAQEDVASVVGLVVSQAGTVPLPGVDIALIDATSGAPVAHTTADERGEFGFFGVRPGTFHVRATYPEFEETTSGLVQTRANEPVRLRLEMPFAAQVERVTVVPTGPGSTGTSAPPAGHVDVDDIRDFQPVNTGDVGSILALMPGVLHGPGGGPISINGGRPTQTRVQLDGMAIVDPVTGRADIDVPGDALQGIEVLPNPAGGEFGRLSAGVIQFATRPAPTTLHYTLDNFIPEPLFRQNGVHGVRDFEPRLFAGGPLLGNRLFVAESAQYQYSVPRVYGVAETPATEAPQTLWNSFTRIDAILSARHTLTASFDVGLRNMDHTAIGRFVAPSAAPSEHVTPYLGSVVERTALGRSATLESAVTVRGVTTDVGAAGDAMMTISPAGRSGDFFNTQHRTEQTVQTKETFSIGAKNRTGEHLVKVGADALLSSYSGTDISHSVELRRYDGSLAERIDFLHPSTQQASGSDAAVFAEDSWTPTPRLKLEPSARLERDGVVGATHLAPRLAATLGLTSSGLATLHAGVGQFYERTPLLATSFTAFEPFTATQYAANGVQPLAPATQFVPAVDSGLHSPSSFIWNVGYDHRLTATWQISAHFLERRGSNELIVQPIVQGTDGALLLDSSGQSIYREASVWGEYRRGSVRASASYVWSRARGDLNALDSFYGTFRNPIIQPNQYGPTSLDVPHRLLAWTSVPAPIGFTVTTAIEYRTGFPYSALNDYQQYVGSPNTNRFPNVLTANLSTFHEVRLGSHVVRLIVRVYNVLNTFNPLEIQPYATAPDFGTAYSHVERRLAIDFDLLR